MPEISRVALYARFQLFSRLVVGVRRALKKGFSWGFAPRRWIGLDHVKSHGKICRDLAQDLFDQKEKQSPQPEDQQLSQEAKLKRTQLALILALVYGLFVIGFICYAWYLGFVKGLVLASIVSLGIAFLFVSYGVRELILYAQFKLRKNKISFGELFKSILKGS